VLRAAEGRSTRSIAEEVGVQPRIVSNWRRRLADHGLAGLEDRPQEAPNYTRHGTTTLFAALEVATGQVIAAHSKRLRRVEFLGSMNHVVVGFPDRELHVILDNLSPHKKCERWPKKHPKVHFHFIPTRSSWLNQIETWLSILQNQSLSGASFTAVADLQEHIDAFISAHNQTATPFAWTKKKVGASKTAVSLSCDSGY
jgi:transposase